MTYWSREERKKDQEILVLSVSQSGVGGGGGAPVRRV